MFADVPEGSSGPFPMLFVTIACGACSGFHALVASGTSSKQIDKESHLLPVGYGAMLVEGLLAIIAVISVCYLAPNDFSGLVGQLKAGKVSAPGAFANGLAHFAVSLGLPYDFGLTFISLAISAFMLTSLDTATRLCRFVWQELILPPERDDNVDGKPQKVSKTREVLANRWFGTILIVILAGWLALSGNGNVIWPVFGASNQLLAALTLLAVTLWLMRSKRPVLFALLPMLFMLVISVLALIQLMIGKFKALLAGIDADETAKAIHAQGTLLLISAVLLVLAVWLVVLGARKMLATWKTNDKEK
ncbi:MAG: carbon starvation protein A [Victivallales bacterium]|nr:carbon starvation protein A [Victivallales bacterium]